MKIIKRDGRIVDYSGDKIRIAIEKANNEVNIEDKITKEEIEEIIDLVESTNKKRMLVEDIQDIIEEALMQKGKYTLAKKYIIYRYARSIIRKSNTTDATIMSLLKNNNQVGDVYLSANRQRDIMAGEASKDLAYRLLLPRNVVEAEKRNYIKFCNVEYFTEPVIESCFIKLSKLYETGTIINNIKIETPKSFQSACNILVEVISAISNLQTGNIYIDFSDLFPYYSLSFTKNYDMYQAILNNKVNQDAITAIAKYQTFIEVKSGIQTLNYQINTITLNNGLPPKVFFLVDTNKITNEIEENIIYELIRQKKEGLKSIKDMTIVTDYPKIVYNLNDDNTLLDSKYGYITNEFLNSDIKYLVMNEKTYYDFYEKIQRFNQGSICLNLARIAIDASNDNKNFFDMLEENLEVCYEGLLCRNHNLQGIIGEKSPLHWKYGVIANLSDGEKIDSLLKKSYSYLTLRIVGLSSAIEILNGDTITKKLIKDKIQDTVQRWNKESNFYIAVSNYVEDKINIELFNKDNESTTNNKYKDDIKSFDDNYISGDFIYCFVNNTETLMQVIEKNIILYN